MDKIMNGKLVRNLRRDKLKEEVSKLKEKLTLVVVSIGENEASKIYIKQKEKIATKIGYNFLNLHFDYIEEKVLLEKIEELNNDKKVTAIIVQLPLPNYLDQDKIINSVSPLKDIDGLTDCNFLKLIKKEEGLIPCTPLGIVNLLDYYQIDINADIVIIGRSRLVGLPLFHLLEGRGATVTLCHSKTKNLKKFTQNADILIVAVGKPGLITKDMVKESAVVVDVGITRIEDKIYGDVKNDVIEKVKLITPVPGGVGPMTVVSLMENVFNAYKLQEKDK